MKPRSAWIRWGQGVVLALPAVALFCAWKCLEGWASPTAGVLLLVYVAGMIAVGVRIEALGWTDESDPRDQDANPPAA